MTNSLELLREKEGHFKHALKMVKLGYWYWVPTTNELVWSEETFNLLGHDPAGQQPGMELFMSNIHADDQQNVQAMLGDVMEIGSTPVMEYRVVRSEDMIVVAATAELIKNEDGSPKYLFGTLQDVTLQKDQQSKLEQVMKKVEEASQAKSDFLASMTHELRTPLNSILGFTQILEMDGLDDKQKDSVNEIIRAGNQLIGLVNEVLDLAEMESTGFGLSVEPVNIGTAIDDCLSLVRLMLEEKAISVAVDATALRNQYVKVDNVRFKQVLLNLLTNAIKYNKQNGQIKILVEARESEVRFVVEDTGCGINELNQQKLFVPFERLGHENGTISGTGVGLVISKKIAEAMSGSIGFTSRENIGSQFWFSLPGEIEIKVDDGVSTVSAEEKEIAPDSVAPEVFKILYIEDNPANLKLIEMAFGNVENVSVLSASTPKLGLDLVKHHDLDLIMLDINLPQMSGYDLLEILKGSPDTANIPVIAVSANVKPKDVEKSLLSGFVEYFTKPVDLYKLKAYVGQLKDAKYSKT